MVRLFGLGGQHPDTLDAMYQLGWALYNQNRVQEALLVHQAVLQVTLMTRTARRAEELVAPLRAAGLAALTRPAAG